MAKTVTQGLLKREDQDKHPKISVETSEKTQSEIHCWGQGMTLDWEYWSLHSLSM
jgi:hypothetical protein